MSLIFLLPEAAPMVTKPTWREDAGRIGLTDRFFLPIALPLLECDVERLAGGHEVVRNLGRVHLETETYAILVEDVDDRVPALGKLGIVGGQDGLTRSC